MNAVYPASLNRFSRSGSTQWVRHPRIGFVRVVPDDQESVRRAQLRELALPDEGVAVLDEVQRVGHQDAIGMRPNGHGSFVKSPRWVPIRAFPWCVSIRASALASRSIAWITLPGASCSASASVNRPLPHPDPPSVSAPPPRGRFRRTLPQRRATASAVESYRGGVGRSSRLSAPGTSSFDRPAVFRS